MKRPWVNLLLLVLLSIQAVTGYLGFTNGRETAAWILVLHGIIAYGLVLLLFLKATIIGDAWRRKKRWTGRRAGFVVVLVLLCLTLLSGLLWTFQGPLYLGGFSLVSLHIYIAVPLMLLMFWHAWHMRFIRRVPGATGRRLFLSGLATALGGLALWAAVGRAKAAAGLTGAARQLPNKRPHLKNMAHSFVYASPAPTRPAASPPTSPLSVGSPIGRRRLT